MTQNAAHTGSIRVVFSPSSSLLKILVVLLLVFSLVALAALTWVRITVQSQADTMRSEAAAVGRRNEVLSQRIEDMESDDTVRAIAKEELGLVDPSTILIKTK